MIEPIAAQLQISPCRVFANTIYFTESGEFSGFDSNEPTGRDGGKAQALNKYVQIKYSRRCCRHYYFIRKKIMKNCLEFKKRGDMNASSW